MNSARLLEPPRMPRRGFTAAVVALALGVAGCGGSEVDYQEVPGEPAEITLPDRTPAGDAATSATEEDAAAEEATATPTAPPAADATTDDTTTDEPATAEATPAPAEDGETNDEPPVPGSDAERFEDFCEQNAGAC